MEQIDLKQLVEQYPEVLTDHTKLKAYILDLYPNCKRGMVNILVAIQQCGIVAEMQASKNSSALEMSRWKKCLEDDVGFTGALAETCLEMWCSAIGIREGNEKTSTAFVTPELQNSQSDWFEYDGTTLLRIKKEYREYEGEIYIPDRVLTIGIGAFSNCKNLTSVVLGSSVTFICNNAFSNCQSLTSITLENNIGCIGANAFSGCKSLESVIIGSGVTIIGDRVFSNCEALESIEVDIGNTTYHSQDNCMIETTSKKLLFGCKTSVIPSDGSVISIGDSAFAGCVGLNSITIPHSVISIGDKAFTDCAGLTSITISRSVKSIGRYAFQHTGLTSIVFPDSVTSIGRSALSFCTSLASIEVSEENTIYHSQGNCVIETSKKKLLIGCKASVIPDDGSVTSIGEDAFLMCMGLTGITIPNCVKSIDETAFYCCSGMKSIMIPTSLRSIGKLAFGECKLKEIQYAGTKAQWKSIKKGDSWNYNGYDTDPYIVNCIDGVIPQYY